MLLAFETCEASRHHQVRTWRRQRAPPPSTGKIQDPPRHEQARAVVLSQGGRPMLAREACPTSLRQVTRPRAGPANAACPRWWARQPPDCHSPAFPSPRRTSQSSQTRQKRPLPTATNPPPLTPLPPSPPRGLCTGAPAIHKGSGMVGCFVGVQPRRLGNRLIPHLP